MTLPRLTRFLRSLYNEKDQNNLNNNSKTALLRKKREKCIEWEKRRSFDWTKLSSVVKQYCKESDVLIKAFLKHTKNIAGKESQLEEQHSAAVFLFDLFKNDEKLLVSARNTIRETFGPFSNEDCDKIFQLVRKIVSEVPSEIFENLQSSENNDSNSIFGRNITFGLVPDKLSDPENFENFRMLTDCTVDKLDLEYIRDESQSLTKEQQVPKNSNKTEDDSDWLRKRMYEEIADSAHISAVTLNILASAKSNDQIQDELFELLGWERIDFISEILQRRQKINLSLLNQSKQVTKKVKPSYGCQIVVQSDKEKDVQKQMRKDDKRSRNKKGDQNEDNEADFDILRMRVEREKQLVEARLKPLLKPMRKEEIKFPFVFDGMSEAKKMAALIAGNKMSLPVGTKKRSFDGYEEVDIPPSQPAPTHIGQHRVQISELDKIGKMGFSGIKELNRIQSVVYPTAYTSNENMLICAPTGAGKTNVAMLTILNTIKQHLEDGILKRDKFKIVYVAPMKALAAEMTATFGRRLESLGVVVKELTGDMQLTKAEILSTQMLVTTPEKWDVVTRKSTGDISLTQVVKLLILDEVHLLHEGRGAVIESIVARTLRQVESSQSLIRIVGLSATLPNYLDVAAFLKVQPYSGLFFFDGRFRPVPLGMTFIGVKGYNKTTQMNEMNDVCYEKVLEQIKKGEQVMVFVHARNETVRTAMLLMEKAKNDGKIELFRQDSEAAYDDTLKQINRSRNRALQQLVEEGFGVHHAGMLRHDRNIVEKLFSKGHIRVLVCTATLAWGVNLPAHAVIIKVSDIFYIFFYILNKLN
ncbi:DgyrCDS10543 [Dimorphilus gyrociliatus]|uniref:U5 small nuclear ribonucleoprotein 200 kDa helicase n=1 Tax=Dimorphilus gyrociliatus TaxID=2664684 RepID=A0A7I8W331_9ANNE|nr:DgyrCDS10543 [Dimorphilus gyrociliatus]